MDKFLESNFHLEANFIWSLLPYKHYSNSLTNWNFIITPCSHKLPCNVTHRGKYVAVHLRTGAFDDLYKFMAKYRTAHSKEDWTKAIDCATMQLCKQINILGLILLYILLVSVGKTKHLISKEYLRVKIFEDKIIHVDKQTNVTCWEYGHPCTISHASQIRFNPFSNLAAAST